MKTVAPGAAIDPALKPYLLDPSSDCGADEATKVDLAQVHRDLLRTGDAAKALQFVQATLATEPQRLAAQAVRAQALLVAGQASQAAELLKPWSAAAADCLPLGVAMGRVHETAGNPAEAYAAYASVAARSAVAERARSAIASVALERTRRDFTTAAEAGRREAAAWHLSRLERYWPNAEPTLRSNMEWARLQGDEKAELAAVKALQASQPSDRALVLRRGQLEVEVGDARTGLKFIEELAEASPADSALQAELGRAKFAWRLQNSPDQVRRLRDKPVLSRADFAVLLYWSVPQIRTARPGAAQIASDIVDHPAREEVARVANLGLMSIDETLHRFSPESPVRRVDALVAFLRLLAGEGRLQQCLPPRTPGREVVCRTGEVCGLVDDPLLCQAGANLSGQEAIEMLRRVLDRLERR